MPTFFEPPHFTFLKQVTCDATYRVIRQELVLVVYVKVERHEI